MRVVNERKWRRAKVTFAWLVFVVVLFCIGGLEGEEEMPYPLTAALLMAVLYYMIYNLHKHWKH